MFLKLSQNNSMEKHRIYDAINDALVRSRKLHPQWPDHVCAQAANVGAAAGELMKYSLDRKYNVKTEGGEIESTKKLEFAAIETAVQAIRFLENLK